MSRICYISNPHFINNRSAGGMGTKTSAVTKAWEDSGIHTIEIATQDTFRNAEVDVIICELLAINDFERIEQLSKDLKAHDAFVFVYGSDSELLRWPGFAIEELKKCVDGWIANCKWQLNYMQDFQLPVLGIVREPIDCDLFRPSRTRGDTVLSGGNISTAKNSEFFIELFNNLKTVETGYIGSASGWGNPDYKSLMLERSLKASVDVFHGQQPANKVATIMGEARFFVVNSHYETCNRMGMEAHAAGLEIVAGPHLCFDEWPNAHRFTTLQECLAILNNFDDADATSADNVEFAKENWSYDASLGQLNDIIRRVL